MNYKKNKSLIRKFFKNIENFCKKKKYNNLKVYSYDRLGNKREIFNDIDLSCFN